MHEVGGFYVSFDERRMEQIERNLGRKLTEEEVKSFLAGIPLQLQQEREGCSSLDLSAGSFSVR